MNDLQGYLDKLEVGMKDKLFFLDHINLADYDYVIDYGCANGKLIGHLYEAFPNTIFINYDKNQEMINLIPYSRINVINTIDENYWKNLPGKKAIIFSSVLHEIERLPETFHICCPYDTLIIRDMHYSKTVETYKYYTHIEKLISILCSNKYTKIHQKQLRQILTLKTRLNFHDEKVYQFLLKYKYETNWEQELKEDYFSFDFQELETNLLNQDYIVTYKQYFQLPHFRKQVYDDFGIIPTHNTHIKLIIQRIQNT